MRLVLFCTGFLSIFAQTVLLREILVLFYGVELIYILAMGTWLVGTGIGALLKFNNERALTVLMIYCFFVPFMVVISRLVPIITDAPPGTYFNLISQAVTLAILIVPGGILSGLLFRMAAGKYIDQGNTAARAYVIESIGGIAGGSVSMLATMIGIQNFAQAISAGLFTLVIVTILDRSNWRTLMIPIGFLVFAAIFTDQADRLLSQLPHPYLLTSFDTPYQRITVDEYEGQTNYFSNNALIYESDDVSREELLLLPLIQRTDYRRILLLGGTMSGLARQLVEVSSAPVDQVEYDKALFRYIVSIRDRAGGNIHITDPRHFLHNSAEYDLIIGAFPEPVSGQSNRFYTSEFFRQCRSALSDDGILAFQLDLHENLMTTAMEKRAASVYAALSCIFPSVLIVPGYRGTFLASCTPLETDLNSLRERLAGLAYNPKLVRNEYIDYLYNNDRLADINSTVSRYQIAGNSDFNPGCYRYGMGIWFERMGDLDGSMNWILPVGILIIALLLVMLLFHQMTRHLMAMFLISAAALILEGIILLLYQSKAGILYQDYGFLIAMHMAGLSVGAFLADKNGVGFHRIHHWLIINFVIIASLIGLLAYIKLLPGFITSVFLLFALGLTVGGYFGYFTTGTRKTQVLVVGPVYAADLLGAALGSIIAAFLLIPVLGVGTSVICVLVVVVLTIFLL